MSLPPLADRLQPALLDRLIDDEPQKQTKEPRDERTVTRSKLRQAVLRDLAWLLNATRPAEREGLGRYPEAERSVLNFGLPPLAGETSSSLDIVQLEQAIRQAIVDFEPRILASTLEVAAVVSETQFDQHNILSIEVRGYLWGQPMPLEMLLRTEVDLETGQVEIRDLGRGS